MSMSSQEFRELQHELVNMSSMHVEFTGFFKGTLRSEAFFGN